MSNWTTKPSLGALPLFGHPLARGLIGAWMLNEGGGGIVQDLSGNGHTGILTNTPTWNAGLRGLALTFVEASTEQVLAPIRSVGVSSSALPLSIVVWYRKHTVNQDCLVSVGTPGATFYYAVFSEESGAVASVTNSSAGFHNQPTTATGTLNTWNQAVAVWTDNNLKDIYLNGGNKVSDTRNAGFVAQSRLAIGATADSTQAVFLSGDIDHVLVYDRVLSDFEVAQLYRDPFAMFERDPIELWVGSVGAGAPTATPKGPLGLPLFGPFGGPVAA